MCLLRKDESSAEQISSMNRFLIIIQKPIRNREEKWKLENKCQEEWG